jgi:hypothetical protein
LSCCHDQLTEEELYNGPRDIPDVKNTAGIGHYLRFDNCGCGCDKLKQKVADLEYDVEQLRLQLEGEGILKIPLRIRNLTNEAEVERLTN